MTQQNTDRGTTFSCAGVIGLGLIGGSIARALKNRAGLAVVGLDTDQAVIEQATASAVLTSGGVISENDRPGHVSDEQAWQLLRDCDVVFVCTPAATVAMTVELASAYTTGLLTDVASVKKPIMDKVSCDRFIGGHPMAGSERRGFSFSSEMLLENAVYVLCLGDDTRLPFTTVKRFEQLIRLIGATPIHLDAVVHDQAVAAVSHLPHVAAAALALLAARRDDGTLTRLAAGGFRDITRIASSDARLWSGISLESRQALLPVLKEFNQIISEFIESLEFRDEKELHKLFYQASQYRGSLPVDGRGALSANSMLTVYITDKPGVLGHVTTLLGNNGINISNIRIRELRAYEGGCLQLMLQDGNQAIKAAWLLQEAGYVCD